MSFLKKTILSIAFLFICLGQSLFPGGETSCAAVPFDDGAEQTVTLPLIEGKYLPMEELIRFAGRTLGISILYNNGQVEQHQYCFSEAVEIPLSEFQGFFERLLLDKDFVYTEDGHGPATLHRVVSMHPSRTGSLVNAARVVPFDELDSYRNRGILVTTCIPLENISCRALVSSMSTFFMKRQPSAETFRTVDESNALIITSFGFKAAALAGFIKEIDGAAGGSGGYETIARIEKRLAALEDKITALKGK